MTTAASTLALTVSEREFTDATIAQAQLLGWRVYHALPARTNRGWRTATQGSAGWPDLAAVHGPYTIYAELKSESGHVEIEQVRWLDALERAAGGGVFLWRPSDADAITKALRCEFPWFPTSWANRRAAEIARMPKRSRDALGEQYGHI